MEENFKAAEFLFKKMKNLYSTFDYPDEFDIELWVEVLEGHSQTEILDALKDYRKETVYNKAPTPAVFKKFLTAKEDNDLRRRILKCADEVGDKYGTAARERYLKAARAQWPDVDLSGHSWTEPEVLGSEKNAYSDLAQKFMQRDIKLNRCRHLLPTYQAAVRYIAEDMLSREMPTSEWRKLSFAERCEKAMKPGLFNQFDDVLILVCRQRSGKDYQFEANRETKPFNPNRASQYLGAHYRADEFSLVEGM